VKAGGMRVSKKQEYGPVEKTARAPGREKTRYCTAGLVPPAPQTQLRGIGLEMSHRLHAAALQVTHQKPRPALEKFVLPK
ncbi:DAPL1 protein, partial [Nycticryphes semicollaris]|nr:DAPL1 protein [Nycticryphes semicollaris]